MPAKSLTRLVTCDSVIWIGVLAAAVTSPLPLTVREATDDADPKLPTVELTVARVKAAEADPLAGPAVASPVN